MRPVDVPNSQGALVQRYEAGRLTWRGPATVLFVWSLQHAFMPLKFDAEFMTFRLLASIPASVFSTVVYLWLRRIVPLAVSHALMDSATVLIPAL